jgi:SAM-dependent methyltransferase
MAHKEQREWFRALKAKKPDAFSEVRVLEVGSLNVNGTIRDFFEAIEYVGVDVGAGPGVDLVCKGEDLDYAANSFDVTVSAECFEHNPGWAATFQNMWRMTKKHVMITCASEGRPEHGTSRSEPGASPFTADWDYYKNLTEADFRAEFDLDEMFTEYSFQYEPVACDLYFYGVKRVSSVI